MIGLAVLGGVLMLSGYLVSVFVLGLMLVGLLNMNCGDCVLVLLCLKGGNDGLNMVIFCGNDIYYNIWLIFVVFENGFWVLFDDYGMLNELFGL